MSAWKRRFIVLATDYATKWVAMRAIVKNDVVTTTSFFFKEIMMRFGHPLELVSDQKILFLNDMIFNITSRYFNKHWKTTLYNPKANGLTKRANGIVQILLNKMVFVHKTHYDRKLSSAIHAYNTSKKRITGKNLFFLYLGKGLFMARIRGQNHVGHGFPGRDLYGRPGYQMMAR